MKIWTSKDYTQLALRTNPPAEVYEATSELMASNPNVLMALHAVAGLGTEIIELDGITDSTNLLEELGDIFWYCALLAHSLNMVFEISEGNVKGSVRVVVTSYPKQGMTGERFIITDSVAREHGTWQVDHDKGVKRMLSCYGEMLDIIKRHMFYWPGGSSLKALRHPMTRSTGETVTNKKTEPQNSAPVRMNELFAYFLGYLAKAVYISVQSKKDNDETIAEAIEVITAANIAKLQARYPDKFDADKAEHRDTAAEMQAINDTTRQ